ncbi:MAG TPA: fibronectin type III domain-containing protein, partial [Burkholderiales bacterium]
MATDKRIWISAFFIVLLASCGGGGGPEPERLPDPPTPATGVTAVPADSQATVTWTAVPGATSYNVYSSSTSPVTKSANKTTVSTPGAALSALTNGAPVFVAVTAANGGGESPLSAETCAVPTAASTAGLTLYDALCAGTLDGSKWRSPLFSRGVVNGALALSAQADNMAPATSIRGTSYMSRADVNAGGHRVTTLQSTLTVPAATASRTGNAELFAGLAFTYIPPANRLSLLHGGALALLRIQVGLVESGNGLRASRRVYHCDNAACTSSSSSGIAFSDPAGFASIGEAAAAYD